MLSQGPGNSGFSSTKTLLPEDSTDILGKEPERASRAPHHTSSGLHILTREYPKISPCGSLLPATLHLPLPQALLPECLPWLLHYILSTLQKPALVFFFQEGPFDLASL